jgi:predicted RNA methylase
MLDDPTIDQRRENVAFVTPAKRKSELGQFMTPSAIANFMTQMFSSLRSKTVCLLDAGAGVGSLKRYWKHLGPRNGQNTSPTTELVPVV